MLKAIEHLYLLLRHYKMVYSSPLFAVFVHGNTLGVLVLTGVLITYLNNKPMGKQTTAGSFVNFVDANNVDNDAVLSFSWPDLRPD